MADYTQTHPVTFIGYDTDPNDDDQNIDAHIQGWHWDMTYTNIIAFSFIKFAAEVTHSNNGATNFTEFTETWKTQQRLAIDEFMKVIGVTFEEQAQPVTASDDSEGVIRFMTANNVGTAFGYYPNSNESGGDITFNYANYDNDANIGTYTFATMMHELGHAMGLAHGHDATRGGDMTDDKDSMEYSIMTYNSHTGPSPNFYTNKDGHYAQTLMMYDIAALHRLYGADYTVESGNSVYTFDTTNGQMFINGVGQGIAQNGSNVNSNVLFRTVWDGAGKDTYDFSNFSTDLSISLVAGGYSDLDVDGNALRAQLNQGWNSSGTYVGASEEVYADGHLYNALMSGDNKSSLIERAIGGTGDDIIVGNEVNNRINGGKGDDFIWGDFGKDDLRGSNGSDELHGGSGADKLNGGKGRDFLYGGAGADKIVGGTGNDVFYGGTGNDTMTGGAGADKFKFEQGDGYDTITDFEVFNDIIVIDVNKNSGTISGFDNGADYYIDYGFGKYIILEGLAGTDFNDLTINYA